jgi:assimilatory nitrate reductase catalytic subunit
MSEPAIRTACPYCGVGCGVLATRQADGTVDIKGDPDHPANLGRLCSKGSALGETMSLDDRVLYPTIRGARASWDTALDLVAKKFTDTIAEHGPDSVAFYVSGQLLTEDYYVANKLMKGFIGSGNIDTNSRLCMASSVAGHKRAFGSDTVPGTYEDLDEADLVVLVGSNLAWCHPVLYQRLAAARAKRGTKVVVIDPRRTATCDIADMHLALTPGSDVALFNGLFVTLVGANASSREYIEKHTSGFRQAFDAASRQPISAIVKTTGLSQLQLRHFYDLFVTTERVVTIYSQGVNQSTSGTDKVAAIINCHLATGRIGRAGMGPFSVTGQPNAMGGREVGGLANMLAAHMDLDNPRHREIVQAFWKSPRIASKPGHKAVDLFRAVGRGEIKALWIMATNPVDSMPEADSVRAAIASCPFVVVSDVASNTDTVALAHVLLSSTAWGEKDGTVTNSERRISRQRAFLTGPGEAKPDWWQLAQVGTRMGYGDAFSFTHPAQIFAEHAALSARDNDGTRDFDIGGYAGIGVEAYDKLAPFQWPQAEGVATSDTRFFGDGGFFTPDRRARFMPTAYIAPPSAVDEKFPLVLNTGRIRDQWHTMTRTGKAARLMAHIGEPFVEIHPGDARALQLEPASLAKVESPHGSVIVRVLVSDRQRRGSVFVPIHWTDQLAGNARVDALVQADVDPVSGQPGLKQTPVAVTAYAASWYGLAVSRSRPVVYDVEYWALSPVKSGWRCELAGDQVPAGGLAAFARQLLALRDDAGTEVLSYHDSASGEHRFAAFDSAGLVGAVYLARSPVAASRTWVADQLTHKFSDPADRLRLLAGRAGAATKDRGAIVCACFDVGRNQIIESITSGACRTVDDIGQALKAGTNCGSCRAEIGRFVHDAALTKAG